MQKIIFFIAVIVVGALFSFLPVTHADHSTVHTIDQLRAQIAEIQKKILELQNINLYGKIFNRDLFYGMENDPDVGRLQQFLTSQKYYTGPLTNNFFSLTQAAVQRFQTSYSISPTGYFGPLSRAQANKILAASNQLPVISSIKGSVTLRQGEIGSWVITASDPEGGKLRYAVSWEGAETVSLDRFGIDPVFTHYFSESRLWTPRFFVMDDQGKITSATIGIEVGSNAAVTIRKTASNDGIVGKPFSASFSVNGGTMPYQWRVLSNIPTGLALTTSGGNQENAVLAGISNQANTHKVDFRVTDKFGNKGEFSYSFEIKAIAPLTVTSPNGYEIWKRGARQEISWNDPLGASTDVYLRTTSVSPTTFIPIASNVVKSPLLWTIPASVAEGSYIIKVSSTADLSRFDESNASFKIIASSSVPTISAIFPSEGSIGTRVTIRGDQFTLSDNTVTLGNIDISGLTASRGSMTFIVPRATSTGVYDVNVSNSHGKSEKIKFTITGGVNIISVETPKAADVWKRGNTIRIGWSAPADIIQFDIQLRSIGANENIYILTGERIGTSFSWGVPVTLPVGQYKVRVINSKKPAEFAESSIFIVE